MMESFIATTMESPFNMLLAAFGVFFFGSFASLVIIFIMHILMPRKVLKTYFKEPHFSATEIVMFTGIPFGYMRTTMFMRALAFPASGKRRGITDAYKLAPVWYCKVSKYVIIFFVINFSLLLLAGGIGGVYMWLYK